MDQLSDDDVVMLVAMIQHQHASMQLIFQHWLMQQQQMLQHRLRQKKAAVIHYLMVINSPVLYTLPLSFFMDVGESRLYAATTPRLDIMNLSDADATHRFRFSVPELARIANAMRLPTIIKANNAAFSAVEALAIMLRRLSFPCRLRDLSVEFGRDVTTIGRLFNHMLLLMDQQYGQHLKLWPGVTAAKVAAYAASITRFNPAVIDVWAFIDGTHRDIARPQLHQRATYNGKHRTHQLRYQLVLAPDGLFVSCCGPFVGTRHDVTILQESGLQPVLHPIVTQPPKQYMIYGDAAYQGEALVLHPFISPAPHSIQARYNRELASLRTRVENNFANMNNHFAMTLLKKSQRSGLQPVALYVMVNVLFINIHTCLNGANVPFDISPPSLEQYLL